MPAQSNGGADFARCRRLTQAREFEQVIRRHQINLVAGPLRIRARTNTLAHARIGIVVPKKGTPTAVRRNRVKRIIREQFRLMAEHLPNLDIVIQVFSDIQDEHLKGQLVRLLGKLSTSSDRSVDQQGQ